MADPVARSMEQGITCIVRHVNHSCCHCKGLVAVLAHAQPVFACACQHRLSAAIASVIMLTAGLQR